MRYLMSADSLYYIYYARDDEEPHFVFIAYSFTLLAPKQLTCKHLLPHKMKYTTNPCTHSQIVSAWVNHYHTPFFHIHFWTVLCGLAGAFTIVTTGIHTSPPLVKQQHQQTDIQKPYSGEGQSVQVETPTHSPTQTLGRLRSPVSV